MCYNANTLPGHSHSRVYTDQEFSNRHHSSIFIGPASCWDGTHQESTGNCEQLLTANISSSYHVKWFSCSMHSLGGLTAGMGASLMSNHQWAVERDQKMWKWKAIKWRLKKTFWYRENVTQSGGTSVCYLIPSHPTVQICCYIVYKHCDVKCWMNSTQTDTLHYGSTTISHPLQPPGQVQ